MKLFSSVLGGVAVPVAIKWASFAGCTHPAEQEVVRERPQAPDLQAPSLLVSQCLAGSDLAAHTAGAAAGRQCRCSWLSLLCTIVQHYPRRFQSQKPLCHMPVSANLPLGACINPLPDLVCCKGALMFFQTSQADKMHPNNHSLGPEGCYLRPSVMQCLRGRKPLCDTCQRQLGLVARLWPSLHYCRNTSKWFLLQKSNLNSVCLTMGLILTCHWKHSDDTWGGKPG